MTAYILAAIIVVALVIAYLRRPKPPTPDDFDQPPSPPNFP